MEYQPVQQSNAYHSSMVVIAMRMHYDSSPVESTSRQYG